MSGIKSRFGKLALLPILILVITQACMAIVSWTWFNNMLLRKVNGDLNLSISYLEGEKTSLLELTRSLASSQRLNRIILDVEIGKKEKDEDLLNEILSSRAENLKLDFISIQSDKNTFVNETMKHHAMEKSIVTSKALQEGEASAFEKSNDGLSLTLIAAKRFSINKKTFVVTVGKILNSDHTFVDKMSRLLSSDGFLMMAGSHGNATLFLNNERISTTIKLDNGERAIGTKVSKAVERKVLDNGERWVDRAWVVNHWAIGGYEPIRDLSNNIIGMLYVGIDEAPFVRMMWLFTAFFSGLSVLFCAAAFILGKAMSKPISEPMIELERKINDFRNNKKNSRICIKSYWENDAAKLCENINAFLDEVDLHKLEMEHSSMLLDGKVKERTKELEDALKALDISRDDLASALDGARAATRAKSAFLANMSHEIRTPLNAIIGLGHLMSRGDLSLSQKEKLEKIKNAGDHLLSIVSNILDISKIEAGKVELEETEFDLEKILRKVTDISGQKLNLKNVHMFFEMSESSKGHYRGDGTRLEQILINLLSNAVKFTEKGEIKLSVNVSEEKSGLVTLSFSISDTGVGIARDAIDRVFEAFEQEDSSTTRRFGGTGLGLSLCKHLVELMGGDITVDSVQGIGSVFKFTIKVRRGVKPTFEVSNDDETNLLSSLLQGKKILVVDDNEINLEMTVDLLKDIGVNTSCAVNGRDALMQLEMSEVALILMDIQMPIMDGLTTTRTLRKMERFKDIPVIALTANATPEDRRLCMSAGMSGYLTKPVLPELLFAEIRRHLIYKH